MNDRHFSHFNIAGFTFYDGVEVFEQLSIGKELEAVAEPDNPFDANSIALYFSGRKLGYVPRNANHLISKFFRQGYTNIFEFRINRIVPDAHTEQQVFVVVRIRENNGNN